MSYYEDLGLSLTVKRKKLAVLATLAHSYNALKRVGCMHKTSCKVRRLAKARLEEEVWLCSRQAVRRLAKAQEEVVDEDAAV